MFSILLENTPLLLAGVFALGLLIGSFLNVVIYRLPIMLERSWRAQCEEMLQQTPSEEEAPRFDLAWPPSRCSNCEHRISALENIPVLSWLVLRGKCRKCGCKISARYPAIELLTALAFLLVAYQFGPTLQTLTGLFLVATLIALTFIDFDHQLLPDNLTLPLLWSGLLLSVWSVHVDATTSILGAVCGYLLLWSVFHGFRLITGKEGMGYGDFKLLAALGAWLGWQSLPLIILLSSLVGAAAGIIFLLTGRLGKDQPIPFGPFLASAGFVTFIWGDRLVQGYFRLLGVY